MGECSDWGVGELVAVHLFADGSGGKVMVPVAGVVKRVWDDCIDVAVSGFVFRYERRAFECHELERGGPCRVMGGNYLDYFTDDDYDPDEGAA